MEFVMTILEGAWRYVTTIRIADYLDIALMAYCCYLLLRLVRSTRAESLVKGIMVFLLALWISHVFKLNGIYFILNHMLDVGILALIVLFQPEIRRILEQVGSSKLRSFIPFAAKQQSSAIENAIAQTVLACTEMSKTRTGVLIVFEREINLDEMARTGTIVIGSNVRLKPVAVTHGGLTVTVSENPQVSQPNPMSQGQTAVVPNSQIDVTEKKGKMFKFDTGATLDDLVRAVNEVGLAPGDLMSVLEALDQAGAIDGQLQII